MITRTYPVPRSVGPLAGRTRVSESLLPVVAAGRYGPDAATWAQRVLDSRPDPLAAAGFDPNDGCSYYAVTDWQEPDLLVAAVRLDPAGDVVSSLERWDGDRWTPVPAHREPTAERLLPLSASLLADVLCAGPGGLLLRPTTPKARVPGLLPAPRPLVAAAPAPGTGGGVFAVVDELDTASVLELFRVDPGPKVSRFTAKGWENDPSLLSALTSVDPPTVVVVPPDQLDAVTEQVTGFYLENPDADEDPDVPETVLAAIDWAETKVVRDASGRFGDKPDSMESESTERAPGGGPKDQQGPGGPEEAPDPMEPHRKAQERREEQIRRQQATWDIAMARRDETENRERDKFDEALSKGEVTEEVARAEAKRREVWARERTATTEAEKVRRLEIAEQERQRRDCIKAGNDPDQCANPKPLAAAGKPATSSMPGNLESYWARGKGAARIRWGSGGDFNRCRRALAKYLKPGQIAGACANLHRKATGSWPGKGREH